MADRPPFLARVLNVSMNSVESCSVICDRAQTVLRELILYIDYDQSSHLILHQNRLGDIRFVSTYFLQYSYYADYFSVTSLREDSIGFGPKGFRFA